MDIVLTTRHLDPNQQLQELIQRRASFVLSRFANLIRRLEVRLTDINGPRGGEDVDCVIVATLEPKGQLVISGRASTPEIGASRGLERLAGALRRHCDQHHQRSRRQHALSM